MIIKTLDFIIYWAIVLIPFSMAISPAPMNVFMGLLIGFFLIKTIIKRERLFPKTGVGLPLLFLFLITCLSLVHSVDIKDTLRGGIGRLAHYALVFFALASQVKDKKHLWRIIASVALGLALTAVDEVWQVFTGRDFIRGYATIINIGLVRATASFKDANVLGIYLSAIAPLIFGLTIGFLKGAKRIVFLVISILALVGITLTFSRPTMLAAFCALLFLGIVLKKRALVVSLVVLVLILPFIVPRTVRQWAKDTDYNPIRFMCNDDRIAIFRNSMNMIKAHPVIGTGANNFMKNYKKYKENPEYRNVVTSDFLQAHNNFLHMAGELGLVGLGIFLWLLYKLFSQIAYIYKRLSDHFLKTILLSLTACLIAFLINGLTESSLYSARVALIFWYLGGLALGIRKIADAKN